MAPISSFSYVNPHMPDLTEIFDVMKIQCLTIEECVNRFNGCLDGYICWRNIGESRCWSIPLRPEDYRNTSDTPCQSLVDVHFCNPLDATSNDFSSRWMWVIFKLNQTQKLYLYHYQDASLNKLICPLGNFRSKNQFPVCNSSVLSFNHYFDKTLRPSSST